MMSEASRLMSSRMGGFMRFEGGEFEDDTGSRQRGSRMGSRMKAFDFDWYKFVTVWPIPKSDRPRSHHFGPASGRCLWVGSRSCMGRVWCKVMEGQRNVVDIEIEVENRNV